MAPTRDFKRAIIAIAATIIAARFFVRQPSQSSESKPKPAPVRTPTVRAPPIQNTTQPKRRKVAVFYNVYAPPRPHNRTCTSNKTWHKDGEPDKNCAWIGSSPKLAARRCRTTSRSAIAACGCECANVSTIRAAEIVDEQLYGASPPADSRLLAHYMTTTPEAPPVKLRRKAGYDAGSAFKRWALRRGIGE